MHSSETDFWRSKEMKLDFAQKYAEKILAELQPFCDRIMTVGSILRQRPEPNDIDFVVLAKDKQAFKARCLKTCIAVKNGDQNFIIKTKTDIQIDIFFAEYEKKDLIMTFPSNWGSIQLCRTGSVEHNIYLCNRAKELGLQWDPYSGVYDSNFNLLAAETEEDIFKALKLDFIPPEKRERG